MKKLYIFTLVYLIISQTRAQAPQGINYQAVARNSNGSVLASQNISIRISIISGSPFGTPELVESFKTTTSNLGLFSLVIGTGTNLSGSINTVTWATADKFLKVEIDPAGGSSYVDMGTTKLQSVPYALYAEKSGSGGTLFSAGNGITITGITITNSAPDKIVTLTGLGGISISGTYPTFSISSNSGTNYIAGNGISINADTINNTSPDKIITLSGSGGTTVNGTYPNFNISTKNYIAGSGITLSADTIKNSAPDKTITLIGTGGTTINGTYPNFNISSTNHIAGNGIKIKGDTIINTRDTLVGGDLNGKYSNPTVVKIQGKDISPVTPNNGQALRWDGASWAPTDISSIYILNSSNYSSTTPGDDKIVNIQGTISLSANYNNLSNARSLISGGSFNGNNLYYIYFGSNTIINGVNFSNIQIDGSTTVQFINCIFNNVTSFPFGCSLTGCQINNSTLTVVSSIGYINNCSISNSTIPRLNKISNSSIISSTIGSSANFLNLSSNNKFSSSTVNLAGTFSGNYCDDTRILGYCSGLTSLNITGNSFISSSMTTNIIEINVAGSSRYATLISNNIFLGNSTSPVGEHVKITGAFTGTRYLTKVSNNVVIGGTTATSQFLTISTSGQIYHTVNDNDYLYTGALGVSNTAYIIERNNVQH